MNYLSLFLNLLNMTVENAAPYLLITIGGVFVARAGVFNISMEGCTEFAAFAGIPFAFMTGQIWVGVIAAFVIAILLNCLFYLFTVKLKGNLSVVGSGINLMAACIPACLLQALYGTRSNLVASSIIDPANMMIDVPVLRSIPILSDIFNNHTAITYLTFLVVIVLTVVMYKTKFGIYVRVTGESVNAAKSVGIKTNRIKFLCLMISAATCALAGLNLSVEQLGMYTINMTANRGFICLSAINCGRKDPEKACVYALIFGFVRALQTIINNFVPAAISSLLGIMPYVTIIVVLLIVETPNARKNHLRFFKEA